MGKNEFSAFCFRYIPKRRRKSGRKCFVSCCFGAAFLLSSWRSLEGREDLGAQGLKDGKSCSSAGRATMCAQLQTENTIRVRGLLDLIVVDLGGRGFFKKR